MIKNQVFLFGKWLYIKDLLVFSPRMWRWSYLKLVFHVLLKIFSTYVEVILHPLKEFKYEIYFLHVCGGDPTALSTFTSEKRFSPRMWRWSYMQAWISLHLFIFSTYVEVIPWPKSLRKWPKNFLHVCGGDPDVVTYAGNHIGFSPRMWRWSLPWIIPR